MYVVVVSSYEMYVVVVSSSTYVYRRGKLPQQIYDTSSSIFFFFL